MIGSLKPPVNTKSTIHSSSHAHETVSSQIQPAKQQHNLMVHLIQRMSARTRVREKCIRHLCLPVCLCSDGINNVPP